MRHVFFSMTCIKCGKTEFFIERMDGMSWDTIKRTQLNPWCFECSTGNLIIRLIAKSRNIKKLRRKKKKEEWKLDQTFQT